MSIRKILVPVRGDGKGENVLAHAAALARLHNGHVEVLHCRQRPGDMIPYGVVVPAVMREQIKKQAQELADAEEKALVEALSDVLPSLGLTFGDGTEMPNTPSVTWHEEQGKMAEVIRPWGRMADLIVVAKPDRERNLGINTLRAALYQCGRPALLCPPRADHPQVLGRKVAIAWNGSLEGSRAVALSLDLLRKTDEAVILDGGSGHEANSGEALKTYLALNGVNASIRPIDGRSDPGGAILSGVAEVAADLLLMGAYSHSREHETVFGGATQTVVDKTTVPVVMVH